MLPSGGTHRIVARQGELLQNTDHRGRIEQEAVALLGQVLLPERIGGLPACFNGRLLEQRKDLAEAETWYRKAAEGGNTAAANNLGQLLVQRGDLAGAEVW